MRRQSKRFRDLRVDPGVMARVEKQMRSTIRDLPTGVLVRMVRAHLDGGGKRLRAQLALRATEALGGRGCRGHAVSWAAACELLHNATLVLDDIQDGDTERHGGRALWADWGVPHAINVGALLLTLPYKLVAHMDAPPELRATLCGALAAAAERLACGQSRELALSDGVGDPRWEAYCRTATEKTSGLFWTPVFGAGLITGRSFDAAREVARPFEHLGLAFQIMDDLLDACGGNGRTQRGSDLYAGRFNALVVRHLEANPDDRRRLRALLALPHHKTSAEAVDRMLERFVAAGTVADVQIVLNAISQEIIEDPILQKEARLRDVAIETLRFARARLDRGDALAPFFEGQWQVASEAP